MLPGLSFAERPRLFAALIAVAQNAGRTIDVVAGGRPAVVLLHLDDVRGVLGSNAEKGRPVSTVRGIQGHIATEGAEFRRRRGAVMAALRVAAAGALPDELTTVDEDGDLMPDTATMLVAHLSGARTGPSLADLARRSRMAMQAAIAAEGAYEPLIRVYAEVEDVLTPSAPFVRDLHDRGWTTAEIAAEIVTLTFAGWASLAAACRSARTVGVGGRDITASDVTELLRVAPPGWLITRETVEPLDLAGRPDRISPGTLLLMSPWLLHRDPASWERPVEFDAARSGTRGHPAYLPFGAGGRNCPAERYSRAFLRGLLSLQPVATASPRPVPSLTDDRSACLVPQEDHPV